MIGAGLLVFLFCRNIRQILAEQDIDCIIGHHDGYYTIGLCNTNKESIADCVTIFYVEKHLGQILWRGELISSIYEEDSEAIIIDLFSGNVTCY